MNVEIENEHADLRKHPMYQSLVTLENIRTFMQYHVFAVWDFMSLLKSLQNKLTCTTVPWVSSDFNPEVVRLINEIVLGEESDVDQSGNAMSHFDIYLVAMEEIGADTKLIRSFLEDFDLNKIPYELRKVLVFHLDLAQNGKVHEIASSFFYGREKLIPEMFSAIVEVLKESGVNCPTLLYYLVRHIEVDGEDHGPKALMCLKELVDTDEKQIEVVDIAKKSLQVRKNLWDFVYSKMAVQ